MNYLQKKKLAFMSIVNRVKGFVRTITGALPLTLEGCVDEESIIDYTLYGQSVQNGTPTPETPIEVESVGEKTRNLFDISSYGDLIDEQKYPYIDISSFEIGTTYTISANDKFVFKINKSAGGGASANGGIQVSNNESFTFTMTETYKSLGRLYIVSRTTWRPSTKAELETQNIQLTESDTVLPYEPYGYKIPIKVSGNDKTITTNIYLDEPLGEGQSINYKKDGLPPLPTFKGTNIISADTTIQPSNAEIEYYSNVKE